MKLIGVVVAIVMVSGCQLASDRAQTARNDRQVELDDEAFDEGPDPGLGVVYLSVCAKKCWEDTPRGFCKKVRKTCLQAATDAASKKACRSDFRKCVKNRRDCLNACASGSTDTAPSVDEEDYVDDTATELELE